MGIRFAPTQTIFKTVGQLNRHERAPKSHPCYSKGNYASNSCKRHPDVYTKPSTNKEFFHPENLHRHEVHEYHKCGPDSCTRCKEVRESKKLKEMEAEKALAALKIKEAKKLEMEKDR